jgi:hypothetical protein
MDVNFWQVVQDVGGVIDGEGPAVARRQLVGLAEWLEEYFAAHPEIAVDYDRNLRHFAMCSVQRLVNALVWALEGSSVSQKVSQRRGANTDLR